MPGEDQLSFRHDPIADARPRLELPELTDLSQLLRVQQNLFFRARGREKLHRADSRKEKERLLAFRKSRGARDSGSLGKRFGQDHARDERITRKVAGEHRIVAREARGAFGEMPRFATKQLPNEHERRAMGKGSDE